MSIQTETVSAEERTGIGAWVSRLTGVFSQVPMLGWLTAGVVAAAIEWGFGAYAAYYLGLPKVPVLFGFVTAISQPVLIPNTVLYMLIIYILPVAIVSLLSARFMNWAAGRLLGTSMILAVLVHLVLLYAALSLWAGISDYRVMILRLTMISVLVTLSLNVVNGYMGEFSCSHPGFMALGAYTASVITVLFFVNDRVFGKALLPPALGPFLFPLALIAGGLVASLGALLVAVPSFRTRGDYLAIISLAFTFIVKSLFENLEFVGGARGFGNQPQWAGLLTVFIWMVLGVWIINNFVRSTLGKALNAVRDGEGAAEAMSVNTERTKMIAFLFSAFWAGVAGGLLAHVLGYINPGGFGIQKLAEVLAMVYFGGLNSVTGSIVGAVGFNMISEMLRPLEILKWIIIPVLLILIMIFRPTGLIAFTEFDFAKIIAPKTKAKAAEEVGYAPAVD